MGIRFIQEIGRKALIIVPKSDLVDQWLERFIEHSSVRTDEIGIVSDGKITPDWESKKIVIGIVHTVTLDRFGEKFRNEFGVVLYDEADSSVPPTTFAPAGSMFPAKIRIAMTASATRTDGLHQVFEKSMAQFRIRVKRGKTMTPTAVMVYYRKNSGFVPSGLQFKQRRGMLLSAVAQNFDRNLLVSKYTNMCYKADRPTLVISDRKEQLKQIRDILIDHFKIPASDIGYYVRSLDGKTITKRYKDKVTDNAKIILGTYGMIRRGTDIKRLSALVMATPQTDLRQTNGRIMRFMEDKKNPVIFDFVDTFYKDLVNSSKSRIRQYDQSGIEIRRVEV
jgi:superfamily II DNA or RNA helicase